MVIDELVTLLGFEIPADAKATLSGVDKAVDGIVGKVKSLGVASGIASDVFAVFSANAVKNATSPANLSSAIGVNKKEIQALGAAPANHAAGDEALNNLEEMNALLIELSNTLQPIAGDVRGVLAPALTEALGDIANFLKENNGEIVSGDQAVAAGLAGAISGATAMMGPDDILVAAIAAAISASAEMRDAITDDLDQITGGIDAAAEMVNASGGKVDTAVVSPASAGQFASTAKHAAPGLNAAKPNDMIKEVARFIKDTDRRLGMSGENRAAYGEMPATAGPGDKRGLARYGESAGIRHDSRHFGYGPAEDMDILQATDTARSDAPVPSRLRHFFADEKEKVSRIGDLLANAVSIEVAEFLRENPAKGGRDLAKEVHGGEIADALASAPARRPVTGGLPRASDAPSAFAGEEASGGPGPAGGNAVTFNQTNVTTYQAAPVANAADGLKAGGSLGYQLSSIY